MEQKFHQLELQWNVNICLITDCKNGPWVFVRCNRKNVLFHHWCFCLTSIRGEFTKNGLLPLIAPWTYDCNNPFCKVWMLSLHQKHIRHNNGWEKKKTDIFRPRAAGPDLKTSDKEFKRDAKPCNPFVNLPLTVMISTNYYSSLRCLSVN